MRRPFAPLTPAKEARMMTRKRMVSVAVVVLLAGGIPARAERGSRPGSEPAEAAKGPGCEGGPPAVVAQFLLLAPEQVQALGQLLQEREQALAPIQQEIAAREQLIEQLIASGGDPAEIGQLVVEVHQLRQAAQAVQAQFLSGFQSLLNDAQRQQWAQVQMAARLQPVVPAFVALGLL
jgi:Spy/CpxP family protein refolding chaperone